MVGRLTPFQVFSGSVFSPQKQTERERGYLLPGKCEESIHSTVSVSENPGTLICTPGELLVVLVLLSYTNLQQKDREIKIIINFSILMNVKCDWFTVEYYRLFYKELLVFPSCTPRFIKEGSSLKGKVFLSRQRIISS